MKTYRIEVTFFIVAENKIDARAEIIENNPSLADASYIEIEEDETA